MNCILLSLFALVAVFSSTSDALKCYVCNSAIDKTSGCASTQALNSSYLKDCSELGGTGKYTVCRKIDQEAPNYSDGSDDVRVIRECGQDDLPKNTCYQKGGFGGRQFVCSCENDGCNAGTSLQTVVATLISFATVALLGPKLLL